MTALPWILAALGWALFALSTWERLREAHQKERPKDLWEEYTQQRSLTAFPKTTGKPNHLLVNVIKSPPHPTAEATGGPNPTNIAMVPPGKEDPFPLALQAAMENIFLGAHKEKAPGGEPGAEEPSK